MFSLWWAGRFCLMVLAFFVFACAVYFLREVVHEGFDPQRQNVSERTTALP